MSNGEKKTQVASEQDRPDVAQKRTEWRASQEQIDPSRVVFIDETWAKSNAQLVIDVWQELLRRLLIALLNLRQDVGDVGHRGGT